MLEFCITIDNFKNPCDASLVTEADIRTAVNQMLIYQHSIHGCNIEAKETDTVEKLNIDKKIA